MKLLKITKRGDFEKIQTPVQFESHIDIVSREHLDRLKSPAKIMSEHWGQYQRIDKSMSGHWGQYQRIGKSMSEHWGQSQRLTQFKNPLQEMKTSMVAALKDTNLEIISPKTMSVENLVQRATRLQSPLPETMRAVAAREVAMVTALKYPKKEVEQNYPITQEIEIDTSTFAIGLRKNMEIVNQNQELANQVMAIRAMFGDMPFDEIMIVLQQFIQKYKKNQIDEPKTIPTLPETPANIKQLAREHGRKGKEKQLQNNVKEKFRLGKFQELFQIWAARLQSQEHGAQAKFIAIVEAHYDEYIDDLIAKDVKMSEKDKVLSPDAVRRWLKRIPS